MGGREQGHAVLSNFGNEWNLWTKGKSTAHKHYLADRYIFDLSSERA